MRVVSCNKLNSLDEGVFLPLIDHILIAIEAE